MKVVAAILEHMRYLLRRGRLKDWVDMPNSYSNKGSMLGTKCRCERRLWNPVSREGWGAHIKETGAWSGIYNAFTQNSYELSAERRHSSG
jgi:hypothetical protein